MRPRSRTLTTVFDSILDDLLMPGFITSKKTRHRVNGDIFSRITCNVEIKDYLKDKIELIALLYKQLTTRIIEISFKNDPQYY